MKKLLNKPLRIFAIYSFIVLLCSIPVYYLIVDHIWLTELDEHNQIFSAKIKKNALSLSPHDSLLNSAITTWNKLQPETTLEPVTALQPDSTYTVYRKNHYIPGGEVDRFQGLVTCFMVNNKAYRLTVETNVEETHETIAAITIVTMLFFLLLLAGLILLNKIVSGKLWQPFYNTLTKIKNYNLYSQEQLILDKTDIVEFSQLNQSVEKLTERNLNIYKEQKEFAENASHELQTPLAVVQSKLDLLLQSQSLTGDQSAIIEHANNALGKIAHINKNLVLLARIENHQFPGTGPVNVSNMVNELFEILSEHIENKQVQHESFIAPDISVQANPVLVEILLTNLLYNAIRHNIAGGKLFVTLSDTYLEISNTGNTTLHEENLFRRFGAASSHNSGSGLGLAIAKQVCSLYSWKIDYQFLGQLHVFKVRF